MKSICLFFGLVAFIPWKLVAEATDDMRTPWDNTNTVTEGVAAPANIDIPFPVGEQLEYKIYWGILYVARSTATSRWIRQDDRTLLSIVFRTRSKSVLDALYPVNDRIEAIIDPATLLPVSFSKILNEGRYHTQEFTTFDHAAGKAKWKRIKKGEIREKEYEIKPTTRDLITFMYMMRAKEFEENTTTRFEVMADEKLYDLEVESKRKEKVVLSSFGKVESMHFIPKAKFQGLFIRKGSMEVWVSTDERQVLSRMEVDTPFANLHLKLDQVTGGGDDQWTEERKKAAPQNRSLRKR